MLSNLAPQKYQQNKLLIRQNWVYSYCSEEEHYLDRVVVMAQKWQGKVVLLTENLKFALGAGQELMTIG